MEMVFAAFHLLAGGPIEAPVSAACAVGHGSHRRPAVTLLIRRSHLLFGNRLAIDGGGWLGTFCAVELADGVGLALVAARHYSVLLVFTTAHAASIPTGTAPLETTSLFGATFS